MSRRTAANRRPPGRRLDTLARTFHEFWRKSSGAGASPAGQPWNELAETFKVSNRRRADLIALQLAQVGIHAAPCSTPAILTLTDKETELLARLEHRRWSIDRRLLGYVYGESRSDSPPRHPLLVDWEQLPQSMREQNLQDMRMLPQMLAAGGLELRREERILAYSDCAARALAKMSANAGIARWHRCARLAW